MSHGRPRVAQRGAGARERRVGAEAGPAAIAAVTAWPVATRPPLAGGARETLGAGTRDRHQTSLVSSGASQRLGLKKLPGTC